MKQLEICDGWIFPEYEHSIMHFNYPGSDNYWDIINFDWRGL